MEPMSSSCMPQLMCCAHVGIELLEPLNLHRESLASGKEIWVPHFSLYRKACSRPGHDSLELTCNS